MLPSLLTAICFALSAVFAARSARLIGGAAANFARMIVALILLAAWAHLFGKGLAGNALPWFLLSGTIGFGLGDIAFFLALTRIGPRLAILLAQCLAAPFGALIERAWLGTEIRGVQLACGAVILLGVGLAVAPRRHVDVHRPTFFRGAFFGVLAALGQALGAVISRKAYFVNDAVGLRFDGGTAAYQRMLGGILIAAFFFAATRRAKFARETSQPARALPWILANALAGPTLGVACYQWALATAPTGVVLPIVATTPVVAIPLAWLIDGDRPGIRSICGGLIAVAGTVALTLV